MDQQTCDEGGGPAASGVTGVAAGRVRLDDRATTRARAIAAVVVIGLAASTGACQREPPAPTTPVAAAPAITWREIGTWSGGGNRQTESFEVSMTAMRLRWRTTGETSPGTGRLIVTLHSAVSGRPLQTIVDAHGIGAASVDVAEEPRWCHFVIEGTNVEWQMTLEQGFASEQP